MRNVDQPLRQQQVVLHVAVCGRHRDVFGGVDRAMDDSVERRRGADDGIVERHAAHESDTAEGAVDRISETVAHSGDQEGALRPGAAQRHVCSDVIVHSR